MKRAGILTSLTSLTSSALLLLFAACGDETAPATTQPRPPSADGCDPGVREADFLEVGPLVGPAVGPDGKLATGGGELVVSTTYLQLKPDVRARFDELNGPVAQTLQTQPGLVALAFAQSTTCGALRTLSVWKDEAAMYGFVASPAHAKAMAAIGELSRGNSAATHWKTADVNAMGWAQSLRALAVDTGPRY